MTYKSRAEYQYLYNNKRWRDKRKAQLAEHPLCAMCQQAGIVKAASIVDHIEPHKGDPVKFWNGALQSLCKPCHDGPKQSLEKNGTVRGCDERGMPLGRAW